MCILFVLYYSWLGNESSLCTVRLSYLTKIVWDQLRNSHVCLQKGNTSYSGESHGGSPDLSQLAAIEISPFKMFDKIGKSTELAKDDYRFWVRIAAKIGLTCTRTGHSLKAERLLLCQH